MFKHFRFILYVANYSLSLILITLLAFQYVTFLNVTTAFSQPVGLLPVLAPTSYAGEITDGKYKYSFNLIFITLRSFILHEEMTLVNGKKNRESRIGIWHQICDGSIVQLTNNQGYYKLLNVGASNNLYIGCSLPTGIQRTVTLQPQGAAPERSFTLTGIVYFFDEKMWLRDTNSDSFFLLKGEKITEFYQKNFTSQEIQHIVSVEVTTSTKDASQHTLVVKKINSINTPQKQLAKKVLLHFSDIVVGHRWLLVKNIEAILSSKYVFEFIDTPSSGEGTLHLLNAKNHITGTYKTQGENIKFTLQHPTLEDATTKMLTETLKKTTSFKTYGNVLEMWDEANCLMTLEKDMKYHKVKQKTKKKSF